MISNLILTSFLLALEKYSERIWWEKPSFQTRIYKTTEGIYFKTPLKANEAFLTRGGILVRKDWTLILYSFSFKEIAKFENLNRIADAVSKGEWDIQLIVPHPSGEKAAVGIADQDNGVYHLVVLNIKTGSWHELTQFKEWDFPGMAPSEKTRKIIIEGGDEETFKWTVYHGNGFAKGKWIGDKIYLWFPPEYALCYGGLYIVNAKNDSFKSFHPKFDALMGVNENYMAYTLFEKSDTDASNIQPRLFIKPLQNNGREFNLAIDDPHSAVLSSHFLLYREADRQTLVLYDLITKEKIASFKVPDRDNRILYLTPSGKRVFLRTRINGKKSLFVYDFRSGKFANLYPEEGEGFHVQACYDGEFFVYTKNNNLWAGYLKDLSKPVVSVKLSPSYRNKVFLNPVNLTVQVSDRCFTSGADEKIKINGRTYKLKNGKAKIQIKFKEGLNQLRISAEDRAGNQATILRRVDFEKAQKVALAELSRNYKKYAGKIVLIEGWIWGYMAKAPKGYSKLPLAKDNTAESRSWGSISDGTAVAYFPVPPGEIKKVKVYTTVKLTPTGWLLKPVYVENIK